MPPPLLDVRDSASITSSTVKPGGVGVRQHARDEGAQPAVVLARRVRLRRRGADERADAAARLDHPGPLELGIDPGHGVGVDAQIDRELTHGRQLIARPQPAGGDRRAQPAFELRVNRRRVARVDGDDAHLSAYTSSLGPTCQARPRSGRPRPLQVAPSTAHRAPGSIENSGDLMSDSRATSRPIVIGLNAVIVAVTGETPRILTVRSGGAPDAPSSGRPSSPSMRCRSVRSIPPAIGRWSSACAVSCATRRTSSSGTSSSCIRSATATADRTRPGAIPGSLDCLPRARAGGARRRFGAGTLA